MKWWFCDMSVYLFTCKLIQVEREYYFDHRVCSKTVSLVAMTELCVLWSAEDPWVFLTKLGIHEWARYPQVPMSELGTPEYL